MSNFKKASKEKLRFVTSKGIISVEQLWDLSMTKLSTIIRNLKKEMNKDNDDELSFLDDTSTPVDKTIELRYNVAKEVYMELKAERDAIKTERAVKEHNEKIMELIAKKQDEDLGSKSVDELKAMLK